MLACFECKDADEINVSALLLDVISSLEIIGCGSILITPSGYLFSYTSGQGRLRNKKCAAFYICCTPLTLTLSDPARVCVTRLCCVVDLLPQCLLAPPAFSSGPFLYSFQWNLFQWRLYTDIPVGS